MALQLKPMSDQVVVVTGATSGIGLVTARMAAERGAWVVLAARDETALRHAEESIVERGGSAASVVADVGNADDVRTIAEAAIRNFGGFDTWVNNAGVSIVGKIEEVPVEDERRLFETNYWGVVNGSRVAVEHLRRRGGALINIGSIASDRAIPLQGAYSASKHAVKGFTDALRMELEADGAPVAVTLIKPASIDTMFEEHAKNYMAVEPRLPPPVYAPELVAEAILHAAEHPVRDLVVGGGGRAIALSGNLAPRFSDRVMERVMFRLQRSDEPARDRPSSLYRPAGDGRERLGKHAYVRERSLYTYGTMHPVATAAIAAGLGAFALAALRRARPPEDRRDVDDRTGRKLRYARHEEVRASAFRGPDAPLGDRPDGPPAGPLRIR